MNMSSWHGTQLGTGTACALDELLCVMLFHLACGWLCFLHGDWNCKASLDIYDNSVSK
jgi:hypothetical protein